MKWLIGLIKSQAYAFPVDIIVNVVQLLYNTIQISLFHSDYTNMAYDARVLSDLLNQALSEHMCEYSLFGPNAIV